MRRLHVTLWLACAIVCGYAAPSRADIVFTASTSGTAPLYSFSLNATVTLNDAETEARVMVQTQLASPACSSIEICYFVKSLRMAGPGLSVAVGADVVVPLTPEQVEALTTEQFSIFATIGPTRPDIAEDVNFSAVLRPAAGQHFRTYVLAEGATGSFFDTDLLILNPNSLPTRLDIRACSEGRARAAGV